MKRIRNLSLSIAASLVVLSTLLPARAQAFSINGFVGKYFSNDEGLSEAGELTFGLLPMIDVGVFYEHDSASYTSTSLEIDNSRSFYGAVGRFTLPILPFFADLRIGPHTISVSSPGFASVSSTGFTTQLGVGYNFGLVPGLSLMPRIGLRIADSNSDYPTWSGSIGLSLSL